ncbi:PTS sorbitol transporter subunit IIA [Staphylococcus cohnii]|uniref:PTS glucitol/sorbitol transporter subunit IIA n=1 Tax=Staphylococcus cohnii TaxID=29382 RepID=UPI000D1C183D|nr:PTS glucitol/sorbitol transporter subunit IIA [Staphylococcus cohnii]PTF25478.1 PTS sorbitol transporter subunit IIA [Staphylococcus cohnii]PTF28841.1 PTS sorbitol transporter subunit IIA [Staphylococcus cohnii]PTG46917.1 PTS sorbitol transporter subunit IIA [Staphylococcus cohnii]RIL86554.1 PTS sorbitol transporter subunit IIA [Staphylococcus cohnii]
MYKSKIVEIGELVSDFKEENLLVLFGKDAPSELADISILHEPDAEEKDILQVNKTIQIAGNKYQILKVGDEANSNFNDLGHVSIYFSDNNRDILPGAILVYPGNFPEFELNEEILVF